jgi:hypothetical protein
MLHAATQESTGADHHTETSRVEARARRAQDARTQPHRWRAKSWQVRRFRRFLVAPVRRSQPGGALLLGSLRNGMSVGASGKVLASSPIQQPDAVGPETQSLPTASSAGRHVFAEREPARIKVRRESALATRLQTSFWRPATTWWACQLLDSAGREAKGSRDIITAHLAVLSLPSRCPCVLQEPKASPSHKVLNMPTILFSVQSPDATEQEIVRGALPLHPTGATGLEGMQLRIGVSPWDTMAAATEHRERPLDLPLFTHSHTRHI